ncbi:MAG TPA: hypothetical protein VJ596_03315 [Gemmatimonadaceae bacterium]|nr:hypothetical protein [Gemmatimonadaceae bacterium]
MAEDDLEHPPRGYDTDDVETQRTAKPKKRRRWKIILGLLLLLPIVAFALYTWVSLTYSYSTGRRAGYVQKFSHKGWLCKTWEGELAMVNLPGTTPEIFRFSVRSDSIAGVLNQHIGKRVSLDYEEHRGIPSDCFGETDYFVTGVRSTE